MNHMTQITSSLSVPVHAVAVAGASGRMGQMLIEAIANAPDCRLTGALDLASSPAVGCDAGAAMGKASGVLVSGDLKLGLQNSKYLIDFTRPKWRQTGAIWCGPGSIVPSASSISPGAAPQAKRPDAVIPSPLAAMRRIGSGTIWAAIGFSGWLTGRPRRPRRSVRQAFLR